MKLCLSSVLATSVLLTTAMAHADQAPPPPPAPAQTPVVVERPVVVAPAAEITVAEPRPAAERPAPEARSGPERHDLVSVRLGARVGYVGDPTFDRFADSDVLTQFSLEATYGILSAGKVSLAVGAAWDTGGRSDGLRGLPSKLAVTRLTVPLEGRYHLFEGVYAFGRVAPGAANFAAKVEDPSSPAPLEQAPWVFATDLSVGASVLVGPRSSLDRRLPRVWVTPEFGYGWTSAATLALRGDRNEQDVLGTDVSTSVGSFAARGVFWRLGASISF